MRLKRLLALLTAIFGLATMTAFGQQPETALPRELSVDVDVVLVNATVTDSQGHYVAQLEREGFRLWEDRIEQKIEYFASKISRKLSGFCLTSLPACRIKPASRRKPR